MKIEAEQRSIDGNFIFSLKKGASRFKGHNPLRNISSGEK